MKDDIEVLIMMNAYQEGFSGRGAREIDAIYRCVDCTDAHLCNNHCNACQDENEICERQLED